MSARAGENARADFGIVEWLRPGDHERAENAIAEMRSSGAAFLRTHLSWAEFLAPGGQEWFDWLLPKLARDFEVLPCLLYTPPSISRTGKTSGAPFRLRDYADFADHILTRYGRHFPHVELWNEPNNLLDWDWREDPDFMLFCEMVGAAAHWVQHRGWRAVLGGPSPFDPLWLDLVGERGLLNVVSAVGFHGFPGTWDSEDGSWKGWDLHLGEMRSILDRYNPNAEIWITETGYSTWRNDDVAQARRFIEAMDVPADRLYWYGWRDIPRAVAVQEGHLFDIRHYHFGMTDAEGRPKLLARLLAEGGVEKVRETVALCAPGTVGRGRPILVTGGSGFIGSNLADRLLADGEEVVVLDNLSRPGVEENLAWLSGRHGERLHPLLADIRDPHCIDDVAKDVKAVFHLAAQTAVTTSLEQPSGDFEVNARGTLNLLEALRRTGNRTPVVFASTNKVYGNLQDVALEETEGRHLPVDAHLRAHGIGEDRSLKFCTPYGCSKGVADQYVLDYAASFGLPTAVLRMSCIYGPRQFGTEDQGWVAHFLIRAMRREPITIFGDGKQVRDVLYVDDVVEAYRTVLRSIGKASGKAFNIGGGPENAVSLEMAIREIARLVHHEVELRRADWRAGDQLYFVADSRALEREAGWRPSTDWRSGFARLAEWVRAAEPDLPGLDEGRRRA